jgi:hypothetical protein
MTEQMLIQLVGELPILAFLLYAWMKERAERIAISERYMTHLEEKHTTQE